MKLKDYIEKRGYFFYALLVPAYLAFFFLVERVITGTSSYTATEIHLDYLIPFCEWFIIPYYLWFPFIVLIGVWLLHFEPDNFRRYLLFVGLAYASSVAIFFIFPNGQNLRPDLNTLGRDNFAIEMLKGIYAADTNTNVLPSIHVVGSIGVIFAVFNSDTVKNKFVKAFTVIFAVLISVSTLLVKQHAILDIVFAIPHAFFWYFVCYKMIKFKKKYEPIRVYKSKKLPSCDGECRKR